MWVLMYVEGVGFRGLGFVCVSDVGSIVCLGFRGLVCLGSNVC